MNKKVKHITLVVGVGLIGFVAWQAGGPERATAPKPPVKAIHHPDGSWCANTLITACVQPSGEVHIPRGEAAETLMAYFRLRPHIPGVEPPLNAFAYEVLQDEPIHTNEVTGRLGARETLERMLDGTVLEARYFDSGIAVRVRE